METTTIVDLSEQISQLKEQISGKVYLPEEDTFDIARMGWNLTVDHRPELVVEVANEADVQTVVRFCQDNRLALTIQATGHGQPRNSQGGVLMILRGLNSVSIDAESKTARIGGSTLWQEVIEAAHPYGLAPISGSSPTVGVVGYTIGGGYGLMSRKYGLAVDNVRSLRIVTPNGDITTASPDENSELFWAALGGGGAFGVITEIEVNLVPHAEFFGGSVMYDASLAPTVVPAFVEWTKTVPDEVGAALIMITFPPVPFVPEFLHGRSMVILAASVITDFAQAEELLRPIRTMEGAVFDSFRPLQFTESAAVYNDPVDPLPANGKGILISDLDGDSVAAMLEAIGPVNESPNLMIQLRHYGGAIARNTGATSASNRNANYLLYLLGIPMGPVTPQMMSDHAEGVFAALKDQTLSRGPLNFLGESDVSGEHIEQLYSSADFEKLVGIKQSVDPNNIFRNASIGFAMGQ
ncbi:MAG: FAD-binding oxidoreductase [Fimbriimonadaceae bacterium]|nr:FAD-binding oxidoreductase [Fimbriimonadaceae bacterium]